ncbi:alpha-galactosidase [Leifsonia sp. NPDC058292]|uniref:alpha-galactosidase n=1 Tax=Leifsonia sp. NPDC058292 TaxID=3346428 RepID=UPI0036DBC8E3
MTITSPNGPALRRFSVLSADGVMLVVEHGSDTPAAVLHWGADLGPLDDAMLDSLSAAESRTTPPATLDSAPQAPLVPQESHGWAGRPGVSARRDGVQVFPHWTTIGVTGGDPSSPRRLTLDLADRNSGLALQLAFAIEPGGLLSATATIENAADGVVDLDWLELALPVPKTTDRLTSFSGRWTREKAPHTTDMPRGATVRQTRRGRSGHDATNLFIASEGRPRNRSGRAWAVHLGWSADTTYRVDRMPDAVTLIGAGELLRGGEARLERGESYTTPVSYFAWSADGLDGLSERFHTYLRSRPQHPSTPRPLVLNTWEAVYFDHDRDTLFRLADVAARVGVERFVLDDGWFHSRRDDTSGLGDWVVDTDVWPDGLGPLADHVHGLGLEFGLWFEPEMVSLDSDLARAHPEWLLHAPASRTPPAGLSWRTQFVLDLANPGAYAHVFGQIDALVGELGIDFIKWDHNRDLVDAVHDGRPGVHAQTLAAYRLIDELKAAHPGLEIESCSSGGARTDLGILQHTDRVWASDSNDPVERQDIQRWTQLLLPPELVGGHVGPTVAHSSGRHTSLGYRMATSLMGSAGFEWNLLDCTDAELAAIARWAQLYKDVRHVISGGTVVHPDVVDPALRVTGFVLPDRSEALYSIATVAALEDAVPERVRLDGLDPRIRYRLSVRDEIGASRHGFVAPRWMSEGGVVLTGSALGEVGLQIPPFWPIQAVVLHLRTEGE